MEIEKEPTFQHVTWVVRNFFDLPQEYDFSLDSPEFLFKGDSYCLRLYPKFNGRSEGVTAFHARRLSVTVPEQNVTCKVGYRWIKRNGDECYYYLKLSLGENDSLLSSLIVEDRDGCVPDGIFTVVCSMRLNEGKSAQGEDEPEGFPGHCTSFSSRQSPTKMELSTESPCTHVELTVPNFFELSRETVDSLTSPEFCFSGDIYCLRFRPNGDTAGTDLQLVRLTFNFLERTVSYRAGYKYEGWHAYPYTSRSLVGSIGVCLSRSKLEEERDVFEWDDTLTVVLFLRMEEKISEGRKPSGLPGIHKLQSDYRQLLQKGTECDACVVVRGKEFQVHRNVLRARSTVFAAMFGHDTTEKESGRVVVDDLDPDSFGVFLEYLYTADVQDKLSDDNAFGLYVAADKYDVSTLKSECVEHMRRTLSVDSFCDVVTLELCHREEDLLQHAIRFFKDNLKRIIITDKWQQFNIDNGATANELLIKALVPGCTCSHR